MTRTRVQLKKHFSKKEKKLGSSSLWPSHDKCITQTHVYNLLTFDHLFLLACNVQFHFCQEDNFTHPLLCCLSTETVAPPLSAVPVLRMILLQGKKKLKRKKKNHTAFKMITESFHGNIEIFGVLNTQG